MCYFKKIIGLLINSAFLIISRGINNINKNNYNIYFLIILNKKKKEEEIFILKKKKIIVNV